MLIRANRSPVYLVCTISVGVLFRSDFCFTTDIVKARTALAERIAEWKQQYQADRISATTDIINFIVQSSGSSFALDAEQFEHDEIDSLIQQVTDSSAVSCSGKLILYLY